MTALLLSALEGGVLRLTLADAATRNSLSEAMMAELKSALEVAAADKAVRVIVLAGLGPAFSSGHNLKEITAHRADHDKGAAYFAALFASCAELMLGIVNNPKPVIAEVAGLASAAGCQLVATCDLAVASQDARFCTPGVNIGLFCSTPMVALSRNLSSKHAMEMLLTGDVFGAEDTASSIAWCRQQDSRRRLPHSPRRSHRSRCSRSGPESRPSTGSAIFHLPRPMPTLRA